MCMSHVQYPIHMYIKRSCLPCSLVVFLQYNHLRSKPPLCRRVTPTRTGEINVRFEALSGYSEPWRVAPLRDCKGDEEES